MTPLSSLGEVLAAIDKFLILHARDLDQQSVDTLLEATAKVSPVEKIVDTGELLYAIRDTLDEDGLTLAGQAIEFATRNGWHGLGTDNRGQRMVDALRRQLGEPHPTGGEWPAKDTDPAQRMYGVQIAMLAYPGPAQ